MYFVVSCVQCKSGHRKCDRLLPHCSLCQQRNISCEYQPPKKRKRKLDPNSLQEDEWDTSIVQYSTQRIEELEDEKNREIQTNAITSASASSPSISKTISVSETNLIDRMAIETYMLRMQQMDKRSISLAKLIKESLSFLDRYGSFSNILSLETILLPPQVQLLTHQFKIHFAFLQSMQAISYYSELDIISTNPVEQLFQLQQTNLEAKMEECFQTAWGTIVSDSSIYFETPTNVLVAWVWASLAMSVSKKENETTLYSMRLLLKNVDSFLEHQERKVESSSLFPSAPSILSAKNEEDHIAILENMRNTVQLLSRTAIDEEYNHSSILDLLKDLKKIIQFLVTVFTEMNLVYTILCNIIQLIEQLQVQFSFFQDKEEEEKIVQIITLFDLFVTKFAQIISTLQFPSDFKFIAMYLAMYELKLRFVEELLLIFQTEYLLTNLKKVKIIIANQMFHLLQKNETVILRKGYFNIRRCILKMTQIHLDYSQQTQQIEFDLKLLQLIQQSYLASPSINLMIEKVTNFLQEQQPQQSFQFLEEEQLDDWNENLFDEEL